MGDAMRRHLAAPRKLLKAHGTVVYEKGRLRIVALVYVQVGTEDKARIRTNTETTHDMEGASILWYGGSRKTRNHEELREIVEAEMSAAIHVYFLLEI